MEKIPLVEKTFKRKDKSITLRHPNVRYAKEKHLLRKAIPITYEMISYNTELCGFDIVSYGEFKGVATKITTKCCNFDCDDTAEKTYSNFINQERYPLCKKCQLLILSINKSNKRPVVAINGSERIEFESVSEAGEKLNSSRQTVYNALKSGKKHSSGYRFEFLD
ncbi:hypothetical protein P4311_07535 [Bacillus thuringiensis]|nr:hypothetical protein [Bacillus thuringiensis]MRB59393.1 hypothetical protein [Bacillus thuringiensis]